MNGLIIGKGWLGKRIENHLSKFYKITTTKRESDALNCISFDLDDENQTPIDVSTFDFIIITIPFGKRNSIVDLEKRFTRLIQCLGPFNKQIYLTSSTGIYPDSEHQIDETTCLDAAKNPNYLFVENLMKTAYPTMTIFRLGGLMGDDRYLSKYLDLNHSTINEVANHVHFRDVIEVIDTCIKLKTFGQIYNVVAPEHPTKKEIISYQVKGKIEHSETKNGKTISSQKLMKELNYQFIFPNPIYFKRFD